MQCIVFEKDQELGKERSSCQHCGVSAPSSGKGVGSSATSFSRATVCVTVISLFPCIWLVGKSHSTRRGGRN